MKIEHDVSTPSVDYLEYNQQKVLDIIKENIVDQSPLIISIDTPFPEVDSLTFIKIVVTLEKEFNFEFDDEMLLITNFSTVKEMVQYVESKVNDRCKLNIH